MTDEADQRPPVSPSAPNAEPGVAEPAVPTDPGAEAPGTAASPPPALPSVSSAQLTAMWSKLGPIGQLIVGASMAVILIVLVGAVIDAWGASGTFALVLVTAAVAAAAAAWFTARSKAGTSVAPIPLETIEFAAGVVATILAVLRVIEMVFDFDDLDEYGGLIGAILTVGLVIAAGAILAGALRRDPTLRTATLAADRGTRIAVAGLALVVIAWVLNLSIGYWRMSAGATSVSLVTFGAVLIVVAPRWKSVLAEIPVAWVGAGFAVVSLLVAVGLWGELMNLGLTQLELDLTDYLPFVLWYLGIIGVIVGGALAGLPAWQARIKIPPPAVVTPPTTQPTAPTPATPPAAPVTPTDTPAPPAEPPNRADPPTPPA